MTDRAPKFIADHTPHDLDGDPFRIGPVAERIAAIVRSVEPPFTISLSGSWGVGKTTLVEEVERRLPDFRIAFIDTWTEDLPQLRWKMAVELGGALADDLDAEAREAARKKTAENLDKVLRTSLSANDDPAVTFPAFRGLLMKARTAPMPAVVVGGVIAGLFVLTMIAVQAKWEVASLLLAVATSLAVFLVVGSGQFVSVRASSHSIAPASEAITLAAEMRRLIEMPEDGGDAVLMIVDNLDRLTGSQAMDVLSDIRAFVDDPASRCVFLIPIDRDAFSRSVQGLVGTNQSARDYLEKFFNLDIVLTRPAGLELRAWTRDLLAELFPDYPHDHSAAAELVAAAANGSPRAAKRMVNGISARYWLLEAGERSKIALPQLAVLEALISQFPHAAAVTGRDARTLTVGRERLRAATEPDARHDAIEVLLPPPGEKDEFAAAQAEALQRFLDFAESVPLSVDEISTVLALRPDPSMIGVPNASAVKEALRSGRPDELRDAIADHTPEELALAFQRGVELAADDESNGFHQGAIAAVDALAPMVEDGGLRRSLRTTAREALVASPAYLLRGLLPATVRLVFEASDLHARVDRIAARAADELSATPSEPRAGLVLVLVAGADRLDQASLDKAKAALAQLPDAEAGPLFAPPSRLLVPGPVAEMLVRRLAEWTPATPDTDIALAVDHLESAVTANVLGGEQLDPIAAAMPSQLPAVTGASVSGLGLIVRLLRHAAPGPNVNALAVALVGWAGDPARGIEWATALPVTKDVHPEMTTAGISFVTSQPVEVIEERLPAMRLVLRQSGADLWGPLAERWMAGEGSAFLRLTLDDPELGAFEAIRAALTRAPISRFPGQFVEAASALADLPAPVEALDLVRDVLVTRSTELAVDQIPAVGPGLAALRRGGSDPGAVVDAVAARVNIAPVEDIAAWTTTAESIAVSVPEGAASLAQAVATRSRALGAMDLSGVAWLIDHGASREMIRDAVGAEVRSTRRTYESLATDLSAIRGKMLKVGVIRLAIVERVRASGPSPDPRPILGEALNWNKVPADQREDYDMALDAILAFGGLNDIVGELRA